VNSPSFHQVFTKFSPGFHQVFTRFWHSPRFHQVLQIHQVFTRCSSRFQNNRHVHQVFGNSPGLLPGFGIHQVLEMHQMFTKFWKFTRCSSSLHQVLEFHQIKPKCHFKTHKLHQKKQKNASFGEFWRCKTLRFFHVLEIHKVLVFFKLSPGFGNSPNFHQVFIFFSKPGRSIRRFQNRIKFSLQ